MRKIHAVVNENDRIFIDYREEEKIVTYYFEEAKTKKKTVLVSYCKEAPSVRSYFGENGKTIRELYEFKRYENKKLVKELNWLWRKLEGKECKKKWKEKYIHKNRYVSEYECIESYDCEYVA